MARDRDGSRIEIGSEVTVVDAMVDWPGHGEYRLVNVRAEVRSSNASSVVVRINGVEVSVDSSQLVCVPDPNARKRGGSLSTLATALTDKTGGGLAGRLRNARSQLDKAKQDEWEAEWAAATHRLKICPRPSALDHPPEPVAPIVPAGVSPRYTSASAFDALGAISDLRAAAQPGRGGIATWNQRKRERENARANMNSFELQQGQQDFAEAQARYDREFAEYERDTEIYEKFLTDDPSWRTQVGVRLAEQELRRLRDAYADALSIEARNPTAAKSISNAAVQLGKSKLPAQWVDDPADPARWRYWDGSRFTAETSPKWEDNTGPTDRPVPTIPEILKVWGVETAPAPPTPSNSSNDTAGRQPVSKAAQLKELFELKTMGAISEDEFNQMKQELIGGTTD